jgi:hypothetical protein
VVTAVVVVIGAGVSFGFGGFGGFGGLDFVACFSGFALPCLACDGGTAGVAGVAGLGFGGFAEVAGTAGVADSCVSELGFGAAGPDEADGSGALAVGGVNGVLPAAVPPLEGGCPGVGAPGVGAGVGAPGDGVGVGPAGVPPGDGPAPEVRTVAAPGPLEAKIGVNPPKINGAPGFVTAGGRAGETSMGTLRTCVLGTESSRVAERSSAPKACIQSWADATAPAATAPK